MTSTMQTFHTWREFPRREDSPSQDLPPVPRLSSHYPVYKVSTVPQSLGSVLLKKINKIINKNMTTPAQNLASNRINISLLDLGSVSAYNQILIFGSSFCIQVFSSVSCMIACFPPKLRLWLHLGSLSAGIESCPKCPFWKWLRTCNEWNGFSGPTSLKVCLGLSTCIMLC